MSPNSEKSSMGMPGADDRATARTLISPPRSVFKVASLKAGFSLVAPWLVRLPLQKHPVLWSGLWSPFAPDPGALLSRSLSLLLTSVS